MASLNMVMTYLLYYIIQDYCQYVYPHPIDSIIYIMVLLVSSLMELERLSLS